MGWNRWRYILPLRLRSIFGRSQMEREIDEELSFHLECKQEEEMSRGAEGREARYRAMRAMGGVEQRKEEMRDMRGVNWISDFWADMRHAVRTIGNQKLFTALVVVTLALGIGANSAIFSLADVLLLRPMPVRRPSEIVTLSTLTPNSFGSSAGPVSYPDYVDYRDRAKSFSDLAAFSFITPFGFAGRSGEQTKLKGGLYASGNLFSAMGVEPALGRVFRADEDRAPGRDAVLVLGHDCWQAEFGGDPSIVGKTVSLNGVAFTVLGVMPEKFSGLDSFVRPDFYLPMAMWPRMADAKGQKALEDRSARNFVVKGRLRAGVSIAQARAEVGTIAASLARAYAKTNQNERALVQTEYEWRMRTDASDSALAGLLLGLAAAVLCIACANVGGLLLARASSRSREIAVRLAIGAGRSRLTRLLLAESLALGLAGGIVGVALGYGGIAFLSRFQISTDLPIKFSIRLDERVLLFTFGVSLLSALVCGLSPALKAGRMDLTTALRGRDTANGSGKLWGRKALVVCQIGASLALSIAALQMVRTFQGKFGSGPGFRTSRLLTMSFNPPLVGYGESDTGKFYATLEREAKSIAGVRQVALAAELPMDQNLDAIGAIPEGFAMPKGRDSFPTDMTEAGPNYFQALGVDLIRGRGFEETDTATSAKVAVVNQEFAKRYWPKADAMGKRFKIAGEPAPVEIIGVTKTDRYEWIGEMPTPFVYLPYAQHPKGEMTLLVETAGASGSVAAEVQRLVRSIDARQPVYNVRTIEEFYARRVAMAPVMITEMVSALGLIGLILTLAGLYGVMTFATNQRTREIGIRMAVGADSISVLRMVLRQAEGLVAAGVVLGLILSVAVGKGLDAVFQTSGVDVGVYVWILPVLAAITMAAALIPAWRAAHIDPNRALREE